MLRHAPHAGARAACARTTAAMLRTRAPLPPLPPLPRRRRAPALVCALRAWMRRRRRR
jgi:hypothetical protein